MRNIAIITARSGSKGLKDKNILPLMGKPMLAYSIEAAIASQLFETVMVSTDSEQYAEIARQYGAEVPFLRSEELSGDQAGSWDVVLEVLDRYQARGQVFDSVCLLQPTSPLRTARHIQEAYAELEEKSADAVTAVCEVDHSPLWTMTLDPSLSMKEYRASGRDQLPRQALPTYYRVNGAVYIRRISYEDTVVLRTEGEYAYIMDRKDSIDIDSSLDFSICEFMMRQA